MFWFLFVLSTLAFGTGQVILPNSPFTPLYYILSLLAAYGLSGINIIKEWERRPVLLFGKYARTAGPGFVWIEPAVHTIYPAVSIQDNVDALEIPNVPTHDNVRLTLMVALTSRISADNIKKMMVEVRDPEEAKVQRTKAAISDTLGGTSLDEFLQNRQTFTQKVNAAVSERIGGWGFEVKAVEIKDFKIADPNIEQAIAMKAKALKEAEAELTRAERQLEIAQKLKAAAATYDEHTWQLKGLETLVELCRSAQNNTVLIPTDLLGGLANVLPEDASKLIPRALRAAQ